MGVAIGGGGSREEVNGYFLRSTSLLLWSMWCWSC